MNKESDNTNTTPSFTLPHDHRFPGIEIHATIDTGDYIYIVGNTKSNIDSVVDAIIIKLDRSFITFDTKRFCCNRYNTFTDIKLGDNDTLICDGVFGNASIDEGHEMSTAFDKNLNILWWYNGIEPEETDDQSYR